MPKSQPSPPMTSDTMSDDRDSQHSLKKTRPALVKANNNTALKKTSVNNSAAPMKKTNDGLGVSISEMLETEYRGISLYTVAMTLLVIAILWTGVSVVEQIQTYHQQYGELQKLKKQFRQLQMEHQRMLIEQQTFSATPQVTNRAVTELNMFYPNLSDRMIIHDNKVTVLGNAANDTNSTESGAQAIDPETQH